MWVCLKWGSLNATHPPPPKMEQKSKSPYYIMLCLNFSMLDPNGKGKIRSKWRATSLAHDPPLYKVNGQIWLFTRVLNVFSQYLLNDPHISQYSLLSYLSPFCQTKPHIYFSTAMHSPETLQQWFPQPHSRAICLSSFTWIQYHGCFDNHYDHNR